VVVQYGQPGTPGQPYGGDSTAMVEGQYGRDRGGIRSSWSMIMTVLLVHPGRSGVPIRPGCYGSTIDLVGQAVRGVVATCPSCCCDTVNLKGQSDRVAGPVRPYYW